MSWLRSWGVSLRVARREARRHKGRSALVLTMIGVPVLGMAFAAASYDMFTLTPAEQVTRRMGDADAMVIWRGLPVTQTPDGGETTGQGTPEPPSNAALLAKLPVGSRAVSIDTGTVRMRTATGVGGINAYAVTIADPMTDGMIRLLSGTSPRTDDEVAVSPQALTRLGTTLGGTVRTEDGHEYAVTALIEVPDQLSEYIVFRSGAMPGTESGQSTQWLVGSPTVLDWPAVTALNAKGLVVVSRTLLLDPPPGIDPMAMASMEPADLALGTLVVGLAVFEIVLLAGPAFAVGARRRQRELALVTANGGTAAQIRRIVLADGVVLGVLGAAIGVVAGVALALGTRPLIEEHLVQARAGGYRIFPLALAGIVVLAVATGLLAALVPAFTAARQNVIQALSGRRGVTRSRKRWIAVGLVLLATGAAITGYGAFRIRPNAILAGLITGQLGFALLTPSLIGLISRVGGALPLAPRIALRDTARNRASAAPAISAVMAVVAGSVMIGIYWTSADARNDASYLASAPTGTVTVSLTGWGPDGPHRMPTTVIDRLAGTVRESVPVDELATIATLACGAQLGDGCHAEPVIPAERLCPYGTESEPTPAEQALARKDERCHAQEYWSYGSMRGVVDDGSHLALLTGADPDQLTAATAVLSRGGVVVTDPRTLLDGQVTLAFYSGVDGVVDNQTVRLPAYAITTGTPGIDVVLSSGAVEALRSRTGKVITAQPGYLVASTTRMPTSAQEDRLSQAVRDISFGAYAVVERGPDGDFDPSLLILALASALITLAAAGVATGLAAADGRADLAALAAVGASPRLRRSLSLSQSGVIAGLGTLLGVLAGVGGAFAIITAINANTRQHWPIGLDMPVAVPWLNMATVLAVPLVAMLGAGLLTRSRLPIERRSR